MNHIHILTRYPSNAMFSAFIPLHSTVRENNSTSKHQSLTHTRMLLRSASHHSFHKHYDTLSTRVSKKGRTKKQSSEIGTRLLFCTQPHTHTLRHHLLLNSLRFARVLLTTE
uniref:(northern house mosquito) hypothetical protein n=1 Tax=Culex pipiens TaxID=7175 RepID=A0A8D8D2U4_CULPI